MRNAQKASFLPLFWTLLAITLGWVANACGPNVQASGVGEGVRLHRLGLFLLDQGSYAESIDYFNRAEAAGNEDALLNFDRCIALSKLDRRDDAKADRDLYHFKAKTQRDAEGLVDSIREQTRGWPDKALERLDKLVLEHPQSIRYRFHKATVLEVLERHEEAVGALRECLKMMPDDPMSLVGIANLLDLLDRPKEALPFIERAQKVMPDKKRVLETQARVLRRVGRLDEALAIHEELSRRNPNNPANVYDFGLALAEKGNLKDSLLAFDRALTINPKDHRAHCERAIVLNRLNRVEEALVAFENSVKAKPDYIKPYFERAQIHVDRKEPAPALIGLQAVLKYEPEHIEALYMKGQLMHLMGNVRGAFFALKKAAQLAPKNEPIQTLYTEVRGMMDDPDAELDPNHKH